MVHNTIYWKHETIRTTNSGKDTIIDDFDYNMVSEPGDPFCYTLMNEIIPLNNLLDF